MGTAKRSAAERALEAHDDEFAEAVAHLELALAPPPRPEPSSSSHVREARGQKRSLTDAVKDESRGPLMEEEAPPPDVYSYHGVCDATFEDADGDPDDEFAGAYNYGDDTSGNVKKQLTDERWKETGQGKGEYGKGEYGKGQYGKFTGKREINQTPKVKLNCMLMKMLRTTLRKGDTMYYTFPTDGNNFGMFQSTVTLSCLPGDWAGCSWAGELAGTAALAEQNAAEAAIKKLEETPELAALVRAAEEFPKTKLDRMKQMRERERKGRADRKAAREQAAREKEQLKLKAEGETDAPANHADAPARHADAPATHAMRWSVAKPDSWSAADPDSWSVAKPE